MIARIAHAVVLSGRAREGTARTVQRPRTVSIIQGILTSAAIRVREHAERPGTGVDVERAYRTQQRWSQFDEEPRTRRIQVVMSTAWVGM